MDSVKDDSESKSLLSNNEQAMSKNKENLSCMYLCCVAVLLGSTIFGMMLGISSPLIPDIQQDKSKYAPHLDHFEASWFVGFLTLGGFAGSLFPGYLAQKAGRKAASIIPAFPYIIGLTVIAFATRTWMLYLGRIITGLSSVFTTLVVPIYVAEIVPANKRGMLASASQVCMVLGILIIYGLGVILPWRWLTAAAILFPLFLLIFSIFIVETPRYHMLKGNPIKARKSLQRLRGPQANIDEEFKEIQRFLDNEVKQATWVELLKEKSLRTPTLLALALVYFQQFSGVTTVQCYAKSLFISAGFTGETQLSAIVLSIAVIQLIFTLLTCLIIDKVGRKVLLIVSGTVMTISTTIFGTYFVFLDAERSSSDLQSTTAYTNTSSVTTDQATLRKTLHLTWMAVISMLIYIASFSVGFGPVFVAYFSEIFPLRARGKAAGLTMSFLYLTSFATTASFSSMLETLTPQGTFWFFAANCALSVVFTIFCLPETKGKSLEEIETYFQS